jgi:hypothetical protein
VAILSGGHLRPFDGLRDSVCEPHLLDRAARQRRLPPTELQFQSTQGQLELLYVRERPEYTGMVHGVEMGLGIQPPDQENGEYGSVLRARLLQQV